MIWQALLLRMLDHTAVTDLCAADIIAMRPENALSLVTRSCRESLLRLVQQREWQSQSSSENPLRRRVPAVIDGRVASPNDSGGEPCHAVQLFRHKLDTELVKQSSRMCFPDPPMPLTDCVLLWSDGCCRYGFALQVFELLSELIARILLLGRKSTFAARQKGSNPMFEEVVPHDLSDACWESWQQHRKCLRNQECE